MQEFATRPPLKSSTAQPNLEASSRMVWNLVKHIQGNKRFLNHDLRGIIGRGIGWARLLPESLKRSPAASQAPLKDVLDILTHIHGNLEKSLEALDANNQRAHEALKVAWIISPKPKVLKASAHNEWFIFHEVPAHELVQTNYRPDFIQIPQICLDDAIQKVLANFEAFGTQIDIVKT